MKVLQKISFSIVAAMMVLSSFTAYSNTQNSSQLQEQEQEGDRQPNRQQDVYPDQPVRYDVSAAVRGEDGEDHSFQVRKSVEKPKTVLVTDKKDSVEDDSVSKYNFIFYFLYKYKYDQD